VGVVQCIANRIEIGRGTALSGIESIDKSFVQKYNKSVVYFTEPFAFPEEYGYVLTGNAEKDGKVLLVFFISVT